MKKRAKSSKSKKAASSRNKRAAMELSVGTIVTIVLLMSVLVLGLVLIRNIFTGGSDAVDAINKEVLNKIGDIFNSDSTTKIVIIPPSRLIKIKKGNDVDLGFAFSIRNTDTTEGRFSYTVTSRGSRGQCVVSASESNNWIVAGREGTIRMPPGTIMEQPEFVRFKIPTNAPPCLVRYDVKVSKDGSGTYSEVSVDVQVLSE